MSKRSNLTKDEFKSRLKGLGLTCNDFCKKISTNKSQVSRWTEGVPKYVEVIIELMEEIQRLKK